MNILLDKKIYDHFNNKRNTKIKIYRSNKILDPDELPENDKYDPDNSPMKFDPN
jgi:hypothetical protein